MADSDGGDNMVGHLQKVINSSQSKLTGTFIQNLNDKIAGLERADIADRNYSKILLKAILIVKMLCFFCKVGRNPRRGAFSSI